VPAGRVEPLNNGRHFDIFQDREASADGQPVSDLGQVHGRLQHAEVRVIGGAQIGPPTGLLPLGCQVRILDSRVHPNACCCVSNAIGSALALLR
jgi:hypothetical protein